MSAAPSQVQSPIPPPPFAKPVPPPPFVDSLFGSLWPERDRTVRPGFVLASVGIGAAGALILPARDAGLGTLLVLLSSGALVFYASVRRRAPWTIVLAVVAVGLSSMLVLRAAGWLSFIAVAIAGLLVMSALTDARGIMSIAGGWLSWGFAAIRGLPLLGRTLAAMSRFSILWPVARTAVISLLALVLFGGLFASGDAVFGSWAEAVLPNIKADGLVLRTFVGFVVTGFVLTACYVAINPPQINRLALPGGKRVSRPFEWLVPVGFVIAIFVAFVAAQATAMWGGHDYVQRTTGLTYAEYVHQGFGQLTLITFLTLVTVAIAARKAPRETAGELLTQRVVLGLLCALALIVVASALFRMNVYQEAYGFTVLRLLVIAFELWLGLLLVLVLIARLQSAAAWVPRAALISGAAFVLAIGLANPEAWVAQRNIDRYNDTGKIDPVYLGTLGDDAVPTIVAGLPRDLAMCILLDKAGSNEPHDALEWNLGRARSADAVRGLELPTWDDCAAIRAAAH
nr:DUF4173 domain-containing protein [Antrihabitans sp. YC2-6]